MTLAGRERQAGTWTYRAALVAGLALLLGANYYLRHTLEDAPHRMYSFMEYFYKPLIPIVFSKPWWQLFLPIRELTGAWATTTLILTYRVERVLTPAGAWELYNAVSITVAFVTSWFVFRSAVFSFTLALCVGFGTQFYHAYAVTGGIASYLLITYHMLLLFTAVQIVRGEGRQWAYWAAFAFSLALNVFGYEGWLDVLVLVWVAGPFVFVMLRRYGRAAEASRLARVALVMTVVGVIYVVMKVKLGYGQTQGAESDVVFNYSSIWPVIDDVVGNVFTHVYLSVSNFFPPSLVGASAFYRMGPDYLTTAQYKYHEPFNYLVIMNQVFLWRYYAGVAFAVVIFALYATARKAWRGPSIWTVALAVFFMMILVGGPTHTLVKFRPMNSEPVMTYHVTVGVLGMSLVISWLLTTAWREMKNRRLAAVVVAAGWAMILYGALARPPYLAHMAAQSGLGEDLYPNPMRTLLTKVGREYAGPRGMAPYRLAPFRIDSDLARARALLADLPMRVPAVEQWTVSAQHASVTKLAEGSIDVLGDDSQTGYQLISPAFPVQRLTQYLLRVRFDVTEGRVCAGVLSGDQQRWLVPPDGTTAEYTFNSAELNSLRVVIANCNGQEHGNSRSRMRVVGGSFAALMGATP